MDKRQNNQKPGSAQNARKIEGKVEVLRTRPRPSGKHNYLMLRKRLKNVLEEREKEEFDREEEDREE